MVFKRGILNMILLMLQKWIEKEPGLGTVSVEVR